MQAWFLGQVYSIQKCSSDRSLIDIYLPLPLFAQQHPIFINSYREGLSPRRYCQEDKAFQSVDYTANFVPIYEETEERKNSHTRMGRHSKKQTHNWRTSCSHPTLWCCQAMDAMVCFAEARTSTVLLSNHHSAKATNRIELLRPFDSSKSIFDYWLQKRL